ncbi:E-selectin-like [Cyprinus carpio]|uniref:E-selectin-like n=1 Tax=Cyprinus carpio TaxID=7962 RepID=A0A9Q9VPI6_CYPCA|nr:E-selectin-like [Cyprinus carpio]
MHGQRTIECMSDGKWDQPFPVCRELTCELKSTKINPEGKIIFRAGESVEITCSKKRLWFLKETSKTFTCQENGEWDHKPVCGEIRCEVPRDQHVSHPDFYFRGDMKLGAKQNYYCESGYEKMAEEATCTRDGWTPNPLCAEMTVSRKLWTTTTSEQCRYSRNGQKRNTLQERVLNTSALINTHWIRAPLICVTLSPNT